MSYPLRLGDDRPANLRQALTERPFGRLALVQFLSLAGDTFVTVALAGSLFFSISLKAARGRVALSLLFTIAPFAIVAPFLGPVIERLKGGRRAVMLLSSVVRLVAAVLMAAWVHSLLIFVAALLSLVFSKAYGVSKASLVPAIVDHPDQLVEANSKLSIGGVAAGIAAAAPAAAIFKLFGSATLLRVDAVVFGAAALATLRLKVSAPPDQRTAAVEPAGVGADSRSGKQSGPVNDDLPGAVGPRPVVGSLQLAAGVIGTLRFLVGFMTFLVAFSFHDSHAPAYWFGFVLLAAYAGNIGGAAVAPALRDRYPEERIVVAALAAVVLTAPLVMLFSTLHRWPAAVVLAFVVGLAAGGGKLAFDSLVQRDVPSGKQGRLFARLEAGFQVIWVVGALIPVLISTPLVIGFLVVAVVSSASLVSYLWGVHLARRGELPAWFPVGPPRSQPPVAGDVLGGPVG